MTLLAAVHLVHIDLLSFLEIESEMGGRKEEDRYRPG